MTLTTFEVYQQLGKACAAAGGQSAWGRKHGFSPAYLSDVLNGRRALGPALLRKLGLRQVTLYVPISTAEVGDKPL